MYTPLTPYSNPLVPRLCACNLTSLHTYTYTDTNPPDPPYQPSSFHIVPKPDRFKGSITETEDFYVPIAHGNNGTSYEADEVARCVRDGRIESERMTWEESRVVQGWFDTVRKSGPTKTAGLAGKAGL
jgi:hypothetical protein